MCDFLNKMFYVVFLILFVLTFLVVCPVLSNKFSIERKMLEKENIRKIEEYMLTLVLHGAYLAYGVTWAN